MAQRNYYGASRQKNRYKPTASAGTGFPKASQVITDCNITQAACKLDVLLAESPFLVTLTDLETLESHLDVFTEPKTGIRHLRQRNSDEQMIFEFPAVILEAELGPVRDSSYCRLDAQPEHAMQTVWLFGAGSERFKSIGVAMDLLLKYFSERVPVKTSNLLYKRHEINSVVKVSRRWLTKLDFMSPTPAIEDPDIDPRDVLKNMSKKGYAYTESNLVSYFETITVDGHRVTLPCSASVIRAGQLVSVTMSLQARPGGDGKYQVVSMLHSLTVLDKAACRVSDEQRKEYFNGIVSAKQNQNGLDKAGSLSDT